MNSLVFLIKDVIAIFELFVNQLIRIDKLTVSKSLHHDFVLQPTLS